MNQFEAQLHYQQNQQNQCKHKDLTLLPIEEAMYEILEAKKARLVSLLTEIKQASDRAERIQNDIASIEKRLLNQDYNAWKLKAGK